ncbi:hypothetical protein [Burkholderia plantarii]|uniref:hypothetical protein n=1 Tax=Burkholderia plantarii TaxID=41899 RepID=UPI000A4840F7|nr:hypothetical protein [Burkholderia plantarii]WLE63087.1 hypothetical protein GIY62_22355 [Burkholderia plantarii]
MLIIMTVQPAATALPAIRLIRRGARVGTGNHASGRRPAVIRNRRRQAVRHSFSFFSIKER